MLSLNGIFVEFWVRRELLLDLCCWFRCEVSILVLLLYFFLDKINIFLRCYFVNEYISTNISIPSILSWHPSNSKEHGRIFEFGKMSVIPESDQIKYYCFYIKWWKTLIQCKIPIKIKNHCNFYRIETLRGVVTCFRILNTLQISVELDIFEQLSNQNGCVQCILSTSQLTVQLNVLNWAEHITLSSVHIFRQ